MKAWLLPFFLFFFYSLSSLFSQPKSHIEHYNLEAGLPQRTVMNILQDKKGFIWLATWDGLCKFDGYNFTPFKTFPEDSILMKNNRIDKLIEDASGYIWLRSYNREAFRFDPKTEKYVATFKVKEKAFKTTEILPMPSGRVWLTSQTMGAVCVLDTLNTSKYFSLDQKNLSSNIVHTVFEDSSGLSWILTDNGLVKVSNRAEAKNNITSFFTQKVVISQKISFFSAIEIGSEIWFGANDGQILCYNKTDNVFTSFDTGTRSNIISIKKVYDNLFIILTSKDGFLICDRNKTNLKRFDKSVFKELPTNEMLSCFIDSNNNIWLETNSKGVARFNLIDNKLKYYTPNDYGNNTILSPSFFIVEDKMGNVWVHPHGGFSYYDPKFDKLVPFYNNPLSSDWKFSDILHHVYLDKQSNLWLSTRSGGLEKVVFDNSLFKLNDFYSNNISITGFEIRAMMEDSQRNIWLANLKGIISIYDSNRNLKGFLCKDGTISKSEKSFNIMAYTFLQDKKGNIWIGTKGDGIYLLKPKDKTFSSFVIEQYVNDPHDPFSLSNNIVYSIHEDNLGRIWIGSYSGGINLFDSENKRFINHNNKLKNYPNDIGFQVRVVRSHNNKVYVGTTFGLIVLTMDDSNSTISEYRVYSKTYKEKDGIRANDIYNILITKRNEVYIATFGGGISKVVEWDNAGFPLHFKTYDSKNGLSSDIALSITEDYTEHLWINNEGSLTRFNPKDESFEQFNDVSRAIINQHFMEALPLLTSDGELIYGCTHGTLSFFPDKITSDTYAPYLALTNFKVFNENYPLDTKVDDIKEVRLKHDENIFSIEYVVLDYTNSYGIRYAYKLEGFDKDWVNNQKQRTANYTNIPPGKYVFKVRSTNSNGTWVDNERTLLITITPSFWQTNWAYLAYFVFAILMLYIILRSIVVFYRMRDRVLLEQEQMEMKTRFFTDISHEIRTPLTMIVSPIENIMDNEKTHEEIRPQLKLMLRNANRMLNMVNQILDFRKIQKKNLEIKELSIGNFIEDLYNTWFKIAEDQKIYIKISNQIGDEKIWADPDEIEKLISNLISNSVKYTKAGGQIQIDIFKKDKSIAVQVIDEGEGMSNEVLNKLFTRFTSFSKDRSKPSTGIGLSIVKEIVDKHHAKIFVESELDKGSTFTILFPVGLDHFSKDQNIAVRQSETVINIESDEVQESNNLDVHEELKNKVSILIVEDDSELRGFIRSILNENYQVYEAQDGKEGYDNAVRYMPDFILSDLMMPEVDGLEFLRRIRANKETSHIPVILLTAKTNLDDQLEGIISGANDYITKPFSVKLLIAKIENVIRQRQLYANYIGGGQPTDSQSERKELIERNKITDQDELFIRDLTENIYKHLDNSDFTIDSLVSNTNLSRRVFFNKVKSLTGQAPVVFVRDIRIKHAAQLLKTQQYRVKEVTYMVGFSDMRYFSQCFKEMFGVTPNEYKNQYGKDSNL